jgi:hypothetical protein
MKGGQEKMDAPIRAIRSTNSECEETIITPMKALRKELGGDIQKVNKHPSPGTRERDTGHEGELS